MSFQWNIVVAVKCLHLRMDAVDLGMLPNQNEKHHHQLNYWTKFENNNEKHAITPRNYVMMYSKWIPSRSLWWM